MRKLGGSMLLVLILLGGIPLLGPGRAQAIPPLPDLAVSLKLAAMNGQNTVGQEIGSFVRIEVRNVGQASAPGFAIAVVLSTNSAISPQPNPHSPVSFGRLIGQRNVTKPMLPGAAGVLTVEPLRIPSDISWGDYFLTVIIDPGQKIAESNETNNYAQAKLFVLADAQLVEQYYGSQGVLVHFSGLGFGAWKNTIVCRVGTYEVPTTSAGWSSTDINVYPNPGLIPVGSQTYDVCLYDGSKAMCWPHKEQWGIYFTSANPSSGPAGTTVHVICCNCQAQGTKKLVLHNQNYQFIAEVPIVSWTMGEVVGTIPNVPAGTYYFMVTDGGELITHEWKVTFTVI